MFLCFVFLCVTYEANSPFLLVFARLVYDYNCGRNCIYAIQSLHSHLA